MGVTLKFPLDPNKGFVYNPRMIEKKIKKELEKSIGKEKVFDGDEYRVTYSYDATGNHYLPDIVVFPSTETDIENILRIAYTNKIPVTPRGAGVGYTGGSLPVKGGISMVFTLMNKILKIDTENFIAEVEPGVVTYNLQQEVEKRGLFYPPDPASLKTSTLGGNVAENAGGLRCFKYGVTGNYVLGLEAFLIYGRKIHTGGRVIKNVAGYDIKSLLVGSEGTLAVISKIILRLIPLPQYRQLFRLDFKSLRTGAEFINIMLNARISPSVLEFMDESSILAVCQFQGIPVDPSIKASMLVEIDGSKTDVIERAAQFKELAMKHDILDFKMAETLSEQDKLWSMRRNISPAISKLKPKKINEDIVVPTGRIPDTIDYINTLSKEFDIPIVLFGHFGDGNIHTNIMVDDKNKEEMTRAETILDKIFRFVISVNGSITGEHGVGLSKKPFMKYQFSDTELEVFRSVKKVFDPENLLNPEKIF